MALQLQMSWQQNLLHHKRKNGVPVGLRNLGNSCYLNSVLQCLTYTPPLANFCLKNQHSSLCDSASKCDKKKDCPFCILEKRIARSLSTDVPLDSPNTLVNCLHIFAEHFRWKRQEDAHEFLRYVIDACHNTCLRLKKLQEQHRKGGNGEKTNSNTVVKEIFGGALQSQVKCLSCGAESNKVDEIMDISLDILHSSSLKDAMVKFFQPEILDGSNKYKCEKCKMLVEARKQMSILQAPNVLVVQLKRFEGIFGGKIDRAVAFAENLLLSSFMCKASQDQNPEYNLFGTIVHSGSSPESGHYYAYIKNATGRWFCCDDSTVTHSTVQTVLAERVYILFFIRASQRSGSSLTPSATNGVKSRVCHDNEVLKSPKIFAPVKAVNMKLSLENCNGKNITGEIRVNKASPSLQTKFNEISSALTKKGSKISDDVRSAEETLSGGISICKVNKVRPVNGNGYNICGKPSSVSYNSRSSLANGNGNGHEHSRDIGSVKVDAHEGSDLRGDRKDKIYDDSPAVHVNGSVANGHATISCSKRKLEGGSCILLAQDAPAKRKLEEFKEELRKEALSALQSCGWSDKVYEFMRLKKRLRSEELVSQHTEDIKSSLIDDAKAAFISKVPESLKGSLINRLKSLAQENAP